MVVPPNELVSVQVPEIGKPDNATEPVDVKHVGCVIVPITGAEGVTGCVFIEALEDTGETQPLAFVTVNVYALPAGKFMKTAVVPDPVCVNPPGEAVIVQLPTEGNPLNATDPIATEHVGWVIVPTTGAVGV